MRIGMRTVKTAIAATLAIILAEWLHLEYAVSAGIIAILSVQNTKKRIFTTSDSAGLFDRFGTIYCCRIFHAHWL